MSSRSVDAAVAAIAARQHGVIARDQALDAGLTRNRIARRLNAGRWERMHRGVYRIAGAPPSWEQRLMAGWLAVGPDASVSHRSALRLFGVPSVRDSEHLEFQVTGSPHRIPGITVHRTPKLLKADRVRHRGFVVTAPARTLIDAASVLPERDLAEALDDLLRRELVTIPRLIRRMQALPHRNGAPALRALVMSRRGPAVPMSVFETRLFEALRSAGLPLPVPQYRIRAGGRRFALDFAYPDLRLGLEADSRRYHADPAGWAGDLERRTALTLAGWVILHVGWAALDREPGKIVDAVTAVRAARMLTRAPKRSTSEQQTG